MTYGTTTNSTPAGDPNELNQGIDYGGDMPVQHGSVQEQGFNGSDALGVPAVGKAEMSAHGPVGNPENADPFVIGGQPYLDREDAARAARALVDEARAAQSPQQ
jgi:hypothetical protein